MKALSGVFTATRAISALALLAVGIAGQQAPSRPGPTGVDANRLFNSRCAACHGVDGRGGERGPDIVTPPDSGIRPVDETARVIREGVPAGGMPPAALPPKSITALAEYVHKLSTDAREPKTFARVAIRLRDGRMVEGLVQNESGSDLQLLTMDGTLAAVTRDEIASIEQRGRSTMPQLMPRDRAVEWGPGDWPTYNGHVSGNRHSSLEEITRANVAQLRLKWMFQVPGAQNLRTTPVVVEGIMYVTAPNAVYALDARSGRVIWRYVRPRTRGVIGDAGYGVNRGVGVRGDRLYVVTDDARLLALHRANGQLLWDVMMADYREHYGSTAAPLVVEDLVLSGVSGGDEGIRGFVAAFDAMSGREVWRFWTVPAPGEPGSETWKGKAIHHPCAATWLTGSYDAGSDLIFWTTGNPCPDYNGDERLGDNLWSNSVLALERRTGKLRWHYQFTPHDLNDWDAVQTVIPVDATFQGTRRALLLQANRNGFFYVLDRSNGKMMLATPFVTKMNWATGIGPDGRPQRLPDKVPTIKGSLICPAVVGATNWMSPSFDPSTGLFYVMALERCSIYRKSMVWFKRGESFYGGGTQNVPGETGRKYLRAIDIETGRIVWEYPQHGTGETWGGVVSTISGLVFFGDDSGDFAAVDSRTGTLLWRFPANARWHASPMTYAVSAQQLVAIAGGANIFAFGL